MNTLKKNLLYSPLFLFLFTFLVVILFICFFLFCLVLQFHIHPQLGLSACDPLCSDQSWSRCFFLTEPLSLGPRLHCRSEGD